VLNGGGVGGGWGYSDRGNDFCPAPRARRGGTGCDGLSWDLVFWALPGATGGGSGVPTTRWDGGNRQAPLGKPPRRRTDSPSHHLFSVETSCPCRLSLLSLLSLRRVPASRPCYPCVASLRRVPAESLLSPCRVPAEALPSPC
jgi:hypothetical protein